MHIFSIAKTWILSAMFLACVARFAGAAPFAYVANGGFGTVSVIDVETNTIVDTISLPAGSSPNHLAATPDGTRVYVSTGNALTVIDTATNLVVTPPIPLGLGTRNIAITPDGRFAYVAIQFDGRVTVVDTATNAVVISVVTGGQPTGLKVSPDGSRVYVADSLRGMVFAIDTATNTVVSPAMVVGGNPQDLEISRNGAKVYVSNFNSASVSVIDTASNAVQATIAVGGVPYGMDTSLDDRTLYVVDNGSVAVIDMATNTLMGRVTLPAFHTSRDVAITPDGARGYVTINTPQRLLVFDTATNALLGDPILIENGIPEGIVITSPPAAGTIPFASLSASVKVNLHGRYGLSASGTFVLNDASDGIQPTSEVVRLMLSTAHSVLLDETLPATSFKAVAGGGIFQSRDGGDIQMIRIMPMHRRGAYSFQILAKAPPPSGPMDQPITLSLQVGNDTGSMMMSCERGGVIRCQ